MIHTGDCLEVMAGMPEASVDAIVTDPPYGLEFMGKEWDRLWDDRPTRDYHSDGRTAEKWPTARPTYRGGVIAQDWHQRWATEALRVAKPGAYLLAFGGTRTSHRLACAIEDAGWIIRDTLVWAYAQGFPKSKASLKPAWEPIVMARKPGPLRELAIDACRIGLNGEVVARDFTKQAQTPGIANPQGNKRVQEGQWENTAGRWPANVIATDAIFEPGVPTVVAPSLSGTMTAWQSSFEDNEPSPTASPASSAVPLWSPTEPDVSSPASAIEPAGMPADDSATSTDTDRPDTGCCAGMRAGGRCTCGSTAASGRRLAARSPRATSSTTETGTASITDSKTWNASAEPNTSPTTSHSEHGLSECADSESLSDDSANWRRNSPPVERDGQPSALGYSRFFLIPKADRAEREPVFGGLESQSREAWYGTVQDARPHTRDGYEYPRPPRRNPHPTVKPLGLMRHLVRLVTPPGGTVLDPFLGSGTTAIAAEMEGFAWLGIEREAEYVAIAEARLLGVQRGMGLVG